MTPEQLGEIEARSALCEEATLPGEQLRDLIATLREAWRETAEEASYREEDGERIAAMRAERDDHKRRFRDAEDGNSLLTEEIHNLRADLDAALALLDDKQRAEYEAAKWRIKDAEVG